MLLKAIRHSKPITERVSGNCGKLLVLKLKYLSFRSFKISRHFLTLCFAGHRR